MVIVKWILSAIIGVVVGFVVLLINSAFCRLAASIIVGLLAAGMVYGILENSGIGKLCAVVTFLVAGILYLALLGYLDENPGPLFWTMIPFFAPYIVAAYAFFAAKDSNGRKETDDDHTEQ